MRSVGSCKKTWLLFFYDYAKYERPSQEQRSHLRPLHIMALVEGKPTNRVFIDGGASVNLIPRAMFKKLGKDKLDLLATNLAVTDFSGKSLTSDGVVMLNVRAGTVERLTLFVVIPSRSSYNFLLGRDLIHVVGAIPSIVHQQVVLWNDEG